MHDVKRVLIVEDDKDSAEILRVALTQVGIYVTWAVDGEEGFAMALTERPDLILLDIVMPKMDGMQFLEKLRQDKWGKDVAVMILSNLDSMDAMEKGLGKGSFDYIVKSKMDIQGVVKRIKVRLDCI